MDVAWDARFCCSHLWVPVIYSLEELCLVPELTSIQCALHAPGPCSSCHQIRPRPAPQHCGSAVR
uniref:Uncharacterized protein n=1 Tax=Anguilla anguilla TaxID=7936 RepID=A0A0E9P9T4_ANGAN